MAKQKRIGNDPLAWIRSTADPNESSGHAARTESRTEGAETVAEPPARKRKAPAAKAAVATVTPAATASVSAPTTAAPAANPAKITLATREERTTDAPLAPASAPKLTLTATTAIETPAPTSAPKLALKVTTAVETPAPTSAPQLALKQTTFAETPAAIPAPTPAINPPSIIGTPHLLVFSAKTKDAVADKLRDLVEWLDDGGSTHALADMAYTLFAGRSHFNVRAALVADTLDSLRDQLTQALATGSAPGYIAPAPRVKPDPAKTAEGNVLIEALASNKATEAELRTLAELYVSGYNLNWARLYDGARRISMPTYPFAKERYWVPQGEAADEIAAAPSTAVTVANAAPAPTASIPRLHPLVDRNTSTIQGLRFTSDLHGTEFYLRRLQKGAAPTLSGAALLELARAGGAIAAERTVTQMKQLVWSKPLAFQKETELHLHLWLRGEALDFEISAEGAILCQGALGFEDREAPAKIDLASLKQRGTNKNAADLDQELRHAGFDLDNRWHLIREAHAFEDGLLTALELAPDFAPNAPTEANADATADPYALHPALLDGALQTAHLLAWQVDGIRRPHLPYAADYIDIYAPLGTACYAYATQAAADGMNHDIRLLDESGQVLAKLHGYAHKALTGAASASDEELIDLLRRLQRGELSMTEVQQLAGGV
jgi:acyl transferase domain-containing protein